MRRVLALTGTLGAVAVALLMPASGSTSETKEGGTFRVGMAAGTVLTADSALAFIPPNQDLLRPACGALMAYPSKSPPAGLTLVPELARADPIVSTDGKTYTFAIRKDARFSTGAPVTARDVVHTLERIFDPQLKSPVAADFQDIVGARRMLSGDTATLTGAGAKNRTLTLRLVKRVPDFPARTTGLCVVPSSLPADPEGAKAPIPSAAPYYVAQYLPGAQLVLERNPFYRGPRAHRVDRISADLAGEPSALIDQVESGQIDTTLVFLREAELAKRYGVNRSQLFVVPAPGTDMFVLNTSRPLFKDNVALRRAINFAVDRQALVATAFGPYQETVTDQYLPPILPGARDARIYPFRPNLAVARALARGNTRFRRAILYTCSSPSCVAPAQVLQQNLRKIGLDVRIKTFPIPVQVQKMQTRGEPFDIGRIAVGANYNDPISILSIFDGRAIHAHGSLNLSYFDSPKVNALLDRAAVLRGAARYKAYGDLDVQLSREAAPAIPYGHVNVLTLVSDRVGCVVVKPGLDLTAVCLK